MLCLKQNSKIQFHLTLGITANKLWQVNAARSRRQRGLLNVINKQSRSSRVFQTKTIYLETGDARGGLQHIMARHGGDFQRKFGATGSRDVSKTIHDIITQGDWCTYGYQQNNSRGGFTVCYQINERSYLQVVVSSNGFIVTAYPRRRANISDWDYKKKGKKEKRRMSE